jgi:hypothetical protein
MLREDIERLDSVLQGPNKLTQEFYAAWCRIKTVLVELQNTPTNIAGTPLYERCPGCRKQIKVDTVDSCSCGTRF